MNAFDEHIRVTVHTRDNNQFGIAIDRFGGMRPGPVEGTVSFGRSEDNEAGDRVFRTFKTFPLDNIAYVDGDVRALPWASRKEPQT